MLYLIAQWIIAIAALRVMIVEVIKFFKVKVWRNSKKEPPPGVSPENDCLEAAGYDQACKCLDINP